MSLLHIQNLHLTRKIWEFQLLVRMRSRVADICCGGRILRKTLITKACNCENMVGLTQAHKPGSSRDISCWNQPETIVPGSLGPRVAHQIWCQHSSPPQALPFEPRWHFDQYFNWNSCCDQKSLLFWIASRRNLFSYMHSTKLFLSRKKWF